MSLVTRTASQFHTRNGSIGIHPYVHLNGVRNPPHTILLNKCAFDLATQIRSVIPEGIASSFEQTTSSPPADQPEAIPCRATLGIDTKI